MGSIGKFCPDRSIGQNSINAFDAILANTANQVYATGQFVGRNIANCNLWIFYSISSPLAT